MNLPELRKCNGPWHYRGGKGTLLPITEFDIATRGPNQGHYGTTCRSCRDKTTESNVRRARILTVEEVIVAELPNGVAPIIREPVVTSDNLPQWRVTIVKRVEEVVYAKDFLDAASKAGEGEIVKVERLV